MGVPRAKKHVDCRMIANSLTDRQSQPDVGVAVG